MGHEVTDISNEMFLSYVSHNFAIVFVKICGEIIRTHLQGKMTKRRRESEEEDERRRRREDARKKEVEEKDELRRRRRDDDDDSLKQRPAKEKRGGTTEEPADKSAFALHLGTRQRLWTNQNAKTGDKL